jgi:hypothetical protein
VLTSFPPSLSAKAAQSLEGLGVTPVLGRTVVGLDGDGVTIDDGEATPSALPRERSSGPQASRHRSSPPRSLLPPAPRRIAPAA